MIDSCGTVHFIRSYERTTFYECIPLMLINILFTFTERTADPVVKSLPKTSRHASTSTGNAS